MLCKESDVIFCFYDRSLLVFMLFKDYKINKIPLLFYNMTIRLDPSYRL